jgi:ankyrin repeat protein
MSTSTMPYPKIDVRYWTASQVYVECPYCEEIHQHGVKLPGKRISHCYPGGHYEFILPIDESRKLVGYEIDKRWARFINVGLRMARGEDDSFHSEHDERDLDNLFRSKMNISATNARSEPSLKLYEDSAGLETITISNDGDTFQLKRILMAISECVNGNINTVNQYLCTSYEKELFLTGRFESGDTTLIMAAMEKSYEMVSLLLQYGANANAINNNGRSALMEAALWGRIESVKALLHANVDKGLRDHEDRCAIDLAQPTCKNEKERYQRSRLAAADHVHERDGDRRHIVILLRDPIDAEKQHNYTGPLSRSERDKYGFRKDESEMAITFYGPIHSHRVPRITKTAAVLDRGDQFVRISATSGWAADVLPLNDKARPTWIDHVYCIASIVHHKFQDTPSSFMDHGRPGQFYACHAEKKLIAYFIDRHLFLPRDEERDLDLERLTQKAENSLSKTRYHGAACKKVHDLEEKKEALGHELFEADDLLLGDAYDAREVKRLKDEIHAIEREISSLELDVNVIAMRAQERELSELWKRQEMHQNLMELAAHKPSTRLNRAVILSSNEICGDCEKFKERVNKFFGLEIEMEWRT